MARFCSFASHISLLIVVSLSLAIHIRIVSSSPPSSFPARYPKVKYVSTGYHPLSFESPPPAETEYNSLSPPAHPPLGLSRSSESPPPETDGYSKAPISPTTASRSPEQPPLTSPLPSPPDEAPISPAPSTPPPSLPTEDDVESSPEDEDSEAGLWPDHQITSSMPYKSSSSNSITNTDDSAMHEQKPEKQPEEENEVSGEGKAGKGGVGFGVAMGVCMVGLGGLVYMKRRKGNDVRRTRSYMQLAERKSLI